jgi:hypothetical protein
MSTNTSTTGKTSASTPTDSTVRPGLRTGEQVVAVQFGVWGPQEITVRAYSDGGRGGAAYIIVGIGTCLTYAYDQAAVDSYVLAWEAAERLNRSVRLPEFTPATATRRHAGEDMSVLCNVTAEQRRNVLSSTGADGRPVITVTVGAVTVNVHTTTALRSYLAAWCKAATVTGMLEDARDEQ